MMNIVIPMAGFGTRFQKTGIDTPKPLIKVLDKTLIEHSIDSFNVDGRFIFITREFDHPEDNKTLSLLLKKLRPESVEIRINHSTAGATATALLAKEYINNEDGLVIYNCDQYIDWDSENFMDFVQQKNPDAALVIYRSRDPKNSFAKIVDGKIAHVVEKQVISDHALIGFHYWSRGRDFVDSALKLIENFRLDGKQECYISETFNYLPEQHNILPYHVADRVYFPLGTPEDVAVYIDTK
jgi:NDP-sugar pyrophosphorylase family protein